MIHPGRLLPLAIVLACLVRAAGAQVVVGSKNFTEGVVVVMVAEGVVVVVVTERMVVVVMVAEGMVVVVVTEGVVVVMVAKGVVDERICLWMA